MDSKLPVVMIEWIDSVSQGGPWNDREEAAEWATQEIEPCVSVGFVLGETEQAVTITDSYHEGQVGTVLRIPKVAVTGWLIVTTNGEMCRDYYPLNGAVNGLEAAIASSRG